MNPTSQTALDTLLERVEADWENEATHRAALLFAGEHQQLPHLAHFYRQRIEDLSRRERCQRAMTEIQNLAISTLVKTRKEKKPRAKLFKYLALAGAALLLGWIFAVVRYLLG